MAGVPDGRYVTGILPPEMRDGIVEGVDVAAPTQITDLDGAPTELTRISIPRPANIPTGPPKYSEPILLPTPGGPPPSTVSLSYDLPLFPGVQCQIRFFGEATSEHILQLVEFLQVATKKLKRKKANANDVP